MKETPVKDSLDVFVQGARINFEMWGKVLPVFGCNIDGEPMTLPVRFQTPDDKEKFRQKIIDLISKNKLKEFVFVSEAWTVTTKNFDDVNNWMSEHGSLAVHPDKKEIVSVLYCSPSEEIQYIAAINRGKIPTLAPWEIHRSSPRFSTQDFNTSFQRLFILGKAGQN